MRGVALACPLDVRILIKGLWSVRSVNLEPQKYCRNLSMAQMEASISFSITLNFSSLGARDQDAKPMVSSVPSVAHCDRTAPKPLSLASVVRMLGVELSNPCRGTASQMSCLMNSNSWSDSIVQLNAFFSFRICADCASLLRSS